VNAEYHGPTAPLLVRCADPAAEQHLAALLDEVDPRELGDLLRRRWVVVLSDLTLPPSAPPFAAAAFRIDYPARTARLIAIGVLEPWRRRGLGRRLLAGTSTLLRAEGVDRVDARAHPGTAGSSLLISAGFAACHYTAHAGGPSRYTLLL
jgi:GNAT superfamily N-acetyltransferase